MNIEIRPRSRAVIGGLVVLGCLLAPARYTGSLSMSCVSLLAPGQRILAQGGRLIGSVLDGLAAWRGAAAENRRLRARVAELTEQLAQERRRSAEKDLELARLGEYVRAKGAPVSDGEEAVAQVIGEGAGPLDGLLFIDRGSRDDVAKGLAVAAGRSFIGRVRAAGPSASSVLLVTSPGSRIDGLIVETGERGIVVGRGDGTMRMKYVSQTRPARGQSVVTFGLDGLAPRNLLIGLVHEVTRRPGSLTYEVTVKPVRDLRGLAGVVVIRPAASVREFGREAGPRGQEPLDE